MDINYLEVRSRCGYNLWQLRQERGYSVEALAILSGVSECEIRVIEEGCEDFDVVILLALARELNVDFRCILIDLNFRPRSQ